MPDLSFKMPDLSPKMSEIFSEMSDFFSEMSDFFSEMSDFFSESQHFLRRFSVLALKPWSSVFLCCDYWRVAVLLLFITKREFVLYFSLARTRARIRTGVLCFLLSHLSQS